MDTASEGPVPSPDPGTVDASPWAPLRHRWFRLLWPAMLVAYLGVWMQTVGAQWQLVNAPGAGGMVALVQTAAMLPIMLFALPAGVLADVFDRRWLMFTIEVYVFVVAGILAALTAAGLTPPTVMLLFTRRGPATRLAGRDPGAGGT